LGKYSPTTNANKQSLSINQSINQSINPFINVDVWDKVALYIRASGSCIKRITENNIETQNLQ